MVEINKIIMAKEKKSEPTADEKIAQIKAEDLQKRATAFNEELIPLLGKYKLGLGAMAFMLPDGRIGARPQLFDDSEKKPAEKVAKAEDNMDIPTAN